jgi:nucleoside-diphosphate-sugar epimerase
MPTTNSAYGSGDINNFCDENSALNPISLYAKDKIEVEQELMKKKNAISLRLATVFGMSPRMRTDLLINDFVFRAFFDGYVVLYESFFKRNYIHIRDVSRAFLHCLNKFDQMKGNIFNVGLSNANLSKQQLCEQIKLKLPKFNIINNNYDKDPDQRNYIVSNAKIELTGFKTKYSIDDGIEELISGYSCLKKYTYGNI